jgi:cyclophilin family peptidyl-prolyl cis-trans isomerase
MRTFCYNAIIFALLLSFSINSFASPAKKSNSKNNKSNDKVKKMENPKYEITVTQSGKEMGKIIIETFSQEAPKHAANFDSLVASGFYNGTAFHRVISGFMIQGGDPNTKNFPEDRSRWGMGDPSQTMVDAEFNAGKEGWTHKRGIMSAARRGDNINSATSQFFLMHKDSPFLDGQYSIYGQVLEGMDIVDAIAGTPTNPGDAPKETITMKIVKLTK